MTSTSPPASRSSPAPRAALAAPWRSASRGGGAHVVALARTQGALDELDDEIGAMGGQATLVPCDLADFDALDRLGAAMFERLGRLDVLVGNAGILGPLTPLAHADPKDWNKVMAVNVTANWRLIRSLDPLLRASGAGRALFITSGAAHRARMKPYWGPYAVSKAALEAIARTYAAETENTSPIKVMLANPGPLRTRMRALGDARRRPRDASSARGIRGKGATALRAGMARERQALRFSKRPRAGFRRADLARQNSAREAAEPHSRAGANRLLRDEMTVPERRRRLIGNIGERQTLDPGGEAKTRAALDFQRLQGNRVVGAADQQGAASAHASLDRGFGTDVIARERARPHMPGRRRDQPNDVAGAVDGQIGPDLGQRADVMRGSRAFVDALKNAVQRLIFDDDRDVVAGKVALQRASPLARGGDAWSERRQENRPAQRLRGSLASQIQ